MRYIVLCKDKSSFYTSWYDYENFYNSETVYAIIDLAKSAISYDGKTWNEIEEDSL